MLILLLGTGNCAIVPVGAVCHTLLECVTRQVPFMIRMIYQHRECLLPAFQTFFVFIKAE